MTNPRALYRLGLLGGFVLLLREVAVNSQKSARAIEGAAAKVAEEISDAVTFAREMEKAGVVHPEDRQLVMNAYMRGRREARTADRGADLR